MPGHGEHDDSGAERGPGVLYVVATPIGNLEDITLRALEVLRDVDRILAEDTRHTARLLRHHGIDTPCRAFHDHVERRATPAVVEEIERGARLALVSDAGTPLLSDPGFALVRALRGAGADVVPVPGPSAITCALSVAGLAVERFCFEGFLPSRRAARRERLLTLVRESRAVVVFEAPHRIAASLGDMAELLGPERRAVVARELTKLHEQFASGELGTLAARFAEGAVPARGEMVVVIDGADPAPGPIDGVDGAALMRILLDELPPARAARVGARLTGQPRAELYGLALELGARKGRERDA